MDVCVRENRHSVRRIGRSWLEMEISRRGMERSIFGIDAWMRGCQRSMRGIGRSMLEMEISMRGIERCMFFMDRSMFLMERWMEKIRRSVWRRGGSVFLLDGCCWEGRAVMNGPVFTILRANLNLEL